MKLGPYIAGVVATGLVVGWFAPESSDPAASPHAAAARDEADRLAALRDDQWLAGEVVLQREGDGHFYADVEVDGVTVQMLVDTGATTIALTGEDAEALGIEWEEAAVKPVARGASGDVNGVRTRIARVQLGDLEVEDVEAIVVPEGLGISLLGQSFLSQIQRVQMDGDKMTLGG